MIRAHSAFARCFSQHLFLSDADLDPFLIRFWSGDEPCPGMFLVHEQTHLRSDSGPDMGPLPVRFWSGNGMNYDPVCGPEMNPFSAQMLIRKWKISRPVIGLAMDTFANRFRSRKCTGLGFDSVRKRSEWRPDSDSDVFRTPAGS